MANHMLGDTKSKTTKLASSIPGLPWQDGFLLGKGVNAITGGQAPSALASSEVKPLKTPSITLTQHYEWINSEESYKKEVEISASGNYNMSTVSAKGGASYLNNITTSSRSTTLIAYLDSETAGYEELVEPKLSSNAEKLLGENPLRFADLYGHYFISGCRRASRLRVTYRCTAQTEADMKKFTASFGANAPQVFQADASAKFEKAATESHISIVLDIWFDGVSDAPLSIPEGGWTPAHIPELVNWFTEHQAGSGSAAELTLYTAVDYRSPQEVDITPGDFSDLHVLYAGLWDLRCKYNSCPGHYKEPYRSEFNALDGGIPAHQPDLATDAKLRADYQARVDALALELGAILTRMSFWDKVLAAPEPAKNDENGHKADEGPWLFGFSSSSDENIVIHTEETQKFSAEDKPGHTSGQLTFDGKGGRLIIGWKVVSGRTDGHGGHWWKVSDRICGKPVGSIGVKSDYERAQRWSLDVFTVDGADYQFE